MWQYNHSDALYHHGIKGQRWGVRRYQNKDGSLTPAGKKREQKTEDVNKKKEMKEASKNRRTLSDKDLRERIERLRLEKQLKDLTDEDLSPGKKFLADVMSQSGKKAATAFVTGVLLYSTKVALTKKFNAEDAAAYLAPRPKNK